MADHILCEAQPKGLEAHITFLAVNYSHEISQLQGELSKQNNNASQEIKPCKSSSPRSLISTHENRIQALKRDHAAESGVLQ